ncbi:MAG: hypothetical protein JST82_00945 [Bacteroidetes bacterium]|nr:hypothetical protein [Bacteroidota bacterium]
MYLFSADDTLLYFMNTDGFRVRGFDYTNTCKIYMSQNKMTINIDQSANAGGYIASYTPY